MAITNKIKILDRKIKQNEAEKPLSALSSSNLDKYEYLTGEDLNYKPITVEQAKFNYSLLNKRFNKGLEEDKNEGLLKRLKNIENKNEEQLKIIRDKTGKLITN